MRRMVSHESVERSGVKRRAPISHPGGLIACGSLLQWTKENAGNLFGNILLAELPGLHRPPSLEAVPTWVPGPLHGVE